MISYASLALQHAKNIVALNPHGRCSATASEAYAAEYVCQQLANINIDDVQTQKFIGLRSVNLFIALTFGFALSGHAAFWLLRPLFGGWSLVISGLAFAFSMFLLWRKYTFRSYPLSNTLPHGPSQNILARIPATELAKHQVVLLAHLDSHRAVWWYANDFLVKLYLLATPFAISGLPLVFLLYTATQFSWPGFAWFTTPFILLHFVAWFTGVSADLGPNSPGANDNASAIGTVLALAEHLQAEPLQYTEVWLAFTGCEETAAEGMRVLWEQYGETFKDALFLDFEMVGIGERLVYVSTEGIIRRKRIPPLVENLILEAGTPFELQAIDMAGFGTLTEIGVVLEHGGKGVCIMSQRAGSPLPPEWHRLTDTAEKLELPALEQTHEMGLRVLRQIDDLASNCDLP